MAPLDSIRDQLIAALRGLESCVVAFSGGVDSAVVAQAAQLALGSRALAVTGVSHSLAAGELELATDIARQIGIRHEVLETAEFARPEYVRNQPDRCYHCKTELYSQLAQRLATWGVSWVVNGANRDDLGDYRPGMRAGQEHAVRSPLAELGITKAEVRALAAHWQLPVWDKPATPCLSSRVAYGEEVTPERLARIDQAERYLRELGFREVRVRYHRGDLARVEVGASEIERLLAGDLREQLTDRLRALGFQFITLDLQGFRSGSLNRSVVAGASGELASPQLVAITLAPAESTSSRP
ncbi:MAG: ATP-dependent sacrificial sulfur transferase LarE [Planctomycetota bacterium]